MQPDQVIPFSFDLSSLVERSYATLYSHLVTRPTGRALRLGIESQIAELGRSCISVLDFTQVLVLDYSCADEAVAKLIQRFQPPDRPADAYFLARGVAEQHREPLEEVLIRHGLVLVADVEGIGFTLLGAPSLLEQLAWAALQRNGTGTVMEVAVVVQHREEEVASALESLAYRRAVLPGSRPLTYHALTALLS
ncbi:MAG TPA: hypothetical protein VK939_13715 [Longimicrobiales bacterium]|nr:hypothetical protein [Longimicrobiales bacterium]